MIAEWRQSLGGVFDFHLKGSISSATQLDVSYAIGDIRFVPPPVLLN